MNFTSISSISTDYSEKIANLLHKLFNSILEEVVIREEERQDFSIYYFDLMIKIMKPRRNIIQI